MAVTKPKSTSKHGSKKSGLNGHSMAHESVYSGGGREEFLFAEHDQTGQPSFVAMTRKFAHGTSCFLLEKPVANGPMTIPWRGATSNPLCFLSFVTKL